MNHELTVTLSAFAPRVVRHSLEALYAKSMERSLLDDVTLLASEVVTNAVRHSGRPEGDPLTIKSTVADGVLRLEVSDKGDGVHDLRPRSLDPPSGLGFVERLSDRWSSGASVAFRVWFEIDVVTRNTLYRATA
jgi:anti-sigma regulatory factor (Ser/Thr protein kinase)